MKPSLARISRVEAAQAARDGSGRANVLTREGADLIRTELLLGKAGPTFGSGPAKRELVRGIIIGERRSAMERSRLLGEARAHWRAEQTDQ